ncbi:MAG: hypothetical protein LBG20_02235 [Holosporaceae bacterium]|nr:hypothetical protein [Holosporaceae bacterium]
MLKNPSFLEPPDGLLKIPVELSRSSGFWGDFIRCDWWISADKIFGSEAKGLEDFSRIYGIHFEIFRLSIFNRTKAADAAVFTRDVVVYMELSGSFPKFLDKLNTGSIVPTIIVTKTASVNNPIEKLEELKFEQCAFQSLSLYGDLALLSFQCKSYSDSHTGINEDGTKSGTATVKMDLTKWKAENA